MTASVIPFPRRHRTDDALADNKRVIFRGYTADELKNFAAELDKLAQRIPEGSRLAEDHELVAYSQ